LRSNSNVFLCYLCDLLFESSSSDRIDRKNAFEQKIAEAAETELKELDPQIPQNSPIRIEIEIP